MTGFARVRRVIPEGEIVVSLKSVNHRGLDLHFHLPHELDPIENDIRNVIRGGVIRGHIQIHVTFLRAASEGPAPLNRGLLAAYMTAFREAAALYGVGGAVPDLNSALRLPGMLGAGGEEELGEDAARAILDASAEAVAMLNCAREREGAATATELRQRCQTIRALVSRMDGIREGAVPAFQKRLREKLGELLNGAGIEPQRIAQEAALLADRSDIAEELMRLRTHAGQLETMLEGSGEVGKRLDFLLQEMNRESNTILSKTGGLGDLGLTITDLALGAKSEIDKIREQSLNLE
ncbi:MAG TPA: YicC/YloC family endoribonuclease [Candidatus Acidoferrales bacterium]|nr:YicC/YloC family endoribonuclease [Candidatus Acidoferrales bacterium]